MSRFVVISFLFFSFGLLAQPTDELRELAQHYYASEQFDKAESYYEKLYKRSPEAFFYTRLLDCYIRQEAYSKAEKLIKKSASSSRNSLPKQMELADFYEQYDDPKKAKKIYTQLIDELPASGRSIIALYNAFKQKSKTELSYQTLVKGRKMVKKAYPLNIQFADYYGSQGESRKMLQEYLDLLDYNPVYRKTIQSLLSRQVDFEDESVSSLQETLKKELIDRTQKNPNNEEYAEMLTWFFMQKQNFSAALVQMKAIDKRSKGEGRKVFELGEIASDNNDYSSAKMCFEYVVNLGKDKPYYLKAKKSLLNIQFLQVTQQRSFNTSEIQNTIKNYQESLEEIGYSNRTIPMLLELAHIQAYYNHSTSKAKELLKKGLKTERITDIQRAEIKMDLADVYVLEGDIWEAALLYGQIDKDFKYETIGHEAKFKNARIFYYDGEFEYAQSQLDVLKESTSKFIANDALQLSLLITDNFGLDSNYQAMKWFSNADLLIEQHRYSEAFILFDSIAKTYPAHSLGDEILFKKAQAQQAQGKWIAATETLKELLQFHSEDILADDALFQLGEIYQYRLMNPQEAKQYYKAILFEHKGSFYEEEARKRFRKLQKLFSREEID